jgi:predicted DNA-binding transcriptional regulator AlpA
MGELTKSHVIRAAELAYRLGVSRVTLWRWQRLGLLPPITQFGPNRSGWASVVLEEWWESSKLRPRLAKPPRKPKKPKQQPEGATKLENSNASGPG